MEAFAMAQTPRSASKHFKAILLSKNTLARKSRDFCSTMALAIDSTLVARVKEHCLPFINKRKKQGAKKAKEIKLSYWR